MKHLILGAGNLGMDLHRALTREKVKVDILSRSVSSVRGLKLDVEHGTTPTGKATATLGELAFMDYDVIWNTLGNCGPSDDPVRGVEQMDLHYKFPVLLRRACPKARLILFSTHYLNHDPHGMRSAYALSKLAMERAFENDKLAFVARVGSLYGKQKPMSCLPGKIVAQLLSGHQEIARAAENRVSPTPTAWLARYLLALQPWKDHGLRNLAPAKMLPVRVWIERIIEETEKQTGFTAKIGNSVVDNAYPIFSGGGVTGEGPTCLTLWEEYGPKVVRASVEQVRLSNRCR